MFDMHMRWVEQIVYAMCGRVYGALRVSVEMHEEKLLLHLHKPVDFSGVLIPFNQKSEPSVTDPMRMTVVTYTTPGLVPPIPAYILSSWPSFDLRDH